MQDHVDRQAREFTGVEGDGGAQAPGDDGDADGSGGSDSQDDNQQG